jgi:hypothetical protein
LEKVVFVEEVACMEPYISLSDALLYGCDLNVTLHRNEEEEEG